MVSILIGCTSTSVAVLLPRVMENVLITRINYVYTCAVAYNGAHCETIKFSCNTSHVVLSYHKQATSNCTAVKLALEVSVNVKNKILEINFP